MVAGQPVQAPRPTPEEIVSHLRRGLGDAFEYAFVEHDTVVCRVRKEAWVEAVRFVREDPSLGCSFFSWLSAIDWTEREVVDAEAAAAETSEDETSEGDQNKHEEAGGEESARAGEPESEVDAGEVFSGAKARQDAEAHPDVDSRGISPYFQPKGELFEICCHLSAPERGFGVTLKTAVPKEDPSLPSLTGIVRGADWHERECHEMFGIVFEGHPGLERLYLPEDFEGHPMRKSYLLGARVVKPWPGLVDVEEIPPELESRLEDVAKGEGRE